MFTARHEEDLKLSEQATEWLLALEDDDPQVQAQFRQWLFSSARHIEEFLLVSAVYRRLDGIDRSGRIDIQRLIAEASSNVIPLSELRPVPQAPASLTRATATDTPNVGVRRTWVMVVTAVSVALMALGAWRIGTGWQRYVTPSGEQRIVQLEDGSLLTLNSRSEVAVRFSEAAREVHLLVGNAKFKVAHDTKRPFRVYAGDSTIQAVGTEFNVFRRAQETRVAVLEGRVRISRQTEEASAGGIERPAQHDADTVAPVTAPALATAGTQAQLKAGEEARIDADGEITRSPLGKRRLVFNNERLEDVAETFNFYNPQLHIRVQDPIAAERRLTGTFNADTPQSLIQILSAESSLAVEQSGVDLVIRAR
jgi:transmembrane sensor